MIRIKIADSEDIENLARMRVVQQIEDWEKTLPNCTFDGYAEKFYVLTKDYLLARLNKSIFYFVMYEQNKLIAMCAIEETESLPQITACAGNAGRSGCIAGVYTLPENRGKSLQQILMKNLLDFAKKQGFDEITLTTNTPDAKHIYKKLGFKYISDKFYLSLADN